ncbi:MAG: FAD:protein FMN transferase, partial [Actinomycetota bacterium]
DPVGNSVRFLEPGVRINLGGIAKGYVVERGIDLLRRAGVSNAIVTAGGDSRLLGDRRGRPFMVGIRDPRVDGEVAISVPLEDEAISTSGDYERYFEEDGVRYHHIIKPSTGTPAAGVHSATVIGPDAVMTDALSTSVFVMGVDRGLKLIAGLLSIWVAAKSPAATATASATASSQTRTLYRLSSKCAAKKTIIAAAQATLR